MHTKKGPWKICVDPDCPNKPPKKSWGRPAGKKAKAKPAAKKNPAAKKKVSDA